MLVKNAYRELDREENKSRDIEEDPMERKNPMWNGTDQALQRHILRHELIIYDRAKGRLRSKWKKRKA